MSEWIITTAITLGIGVITYFLKRTMSQVDKHGEEIRRIDSERVTKTDLKESTEELKKDIRQIREDYTPKNVHEKDGQKVGSDAGTYAEEVGGRRDEQRNRKKAASGWQLYNEQWQGAVDNKPAPGKIQCPPECGEGGQLRRH